MKYFTKIRTLVKGYKAYGAALALILTNILAVTNGEQSIGDVVNWIIAGGGIAALRAALPTK